MSFTTSDGTFVNAKDVILAPNGVRTASGHGPAIEMGRFTTLRTSLAVTAASGTSPTLDLQVQTSHDGVTWRSQDAAPTISSPTSARFSTGGLDRFARLGWTIGGTTPSFTFHAEAEAI